MDANSPKMTKAEVPAGSTLAVRRADEHATKQNHSIMWTLSIQNRLVGHGSSDSVYFYQEDQSQPISQCYSVAPIKGMIEQPKTLAWPCLH